MTRPPGRRNGDGAARVLALVRECPELSDDRIGACLGMSQQAATCAMRRLGLPALTERGDGWEVEAQLGRCRRCETWTVVPWGQSRTPCPTCGRSVPVSSARLRRVPK